MNTDFVRRAAEKIKTKRLDMVEKDIIIHQILTDLSHDKFYSENFLFKGGTCLINIIWGISDSRKTLISLGRTNQSSMKNLLK